MLPAGYTFTSTSPVNNLGYPLYWSAKAFSLEIGKYYSSVRFSHSVVSNSFRPHGLQHARLLYPSPTPSVYSNSYPSSQWYHPAISSSVIPFSFHLQSFPASGSFPMSQFLASGGQSIRASASVQHIIIFSIVINRMRNINLPLFLSSSQARGSALLKTMGLDKKPSLVIVFLQFGCFACFASATFTHSTVKGITSLSSFSYSQEERERTCSPGDGSWYYGGMWWAWRLRWHWHVDHWIVNYPLE